MGGSAWERRAAPGLRLEVDPDDKGVGGHIGGVSLEEGLVCARRGALRDPGE